MKNTLKLAFIALGFVAFTTSCGNNTTENAADNVEATTDEAMNDAGNAVDEATTPEEGDTARVINQEADAVIKSTDEAK